MPSRRKIDLRQFAVSLGYEMDRRESWRGSTVLRRGADKIVVKRNRNGHYVFFSVRDDSDNGTIIDFLQRRQNLSLGAVRQILRPVDRPVCHPTAVSRVGANQPGSDACRKRVPAHGQRTAISLSGAGALSAVSGAVIAAVCWPCADRPPRQHGVSPFRRRRACADTKSRIADSPALPPAAKRACGSRIPDRTTGVWSWPKAPLMRCPMPRCFRMPRTKPAMPAWAANPMSRQPGLVQATIARLPEGAEIVAAFDADEAGRMLVDVVRGRVETLPSGREGGISFFTFIFRRKRVKTGIRSCRMAGLRTASRRASQVFDDNSRTGSNWYLPEQQLRKVKEVLSRVMVSLAGFEVTPTGRF